MTSFWKRGGGSIRGRIYYLMKYDIMKYYHVKKKDGY